MWASDGSLSYGGIVIVAVIVGVAIAWLISSGTRAAYYRQTAQEWNEDDTRHVRRLPPILIIALLFLLVLGFMQPGVFAGIFGGG